MVKWQFYLYVVALLVLTASSSALQYWLFSKKLKLSGDNIEKHFDKMEKELNDKR